MILTACGSRARPPAGRWVQERRSVARPSRASPIAFAPTRSGREGGLDRLFARGSRRLLCGLAQLAQAERGCHYPEDKSVIDTPLEQLCAWSHGREHDIVGCVHALALRERQIALHARGLWRAIGLVGDRLVVFLLRALGRASARVLAGGT